MYTSPVAIATNELHDWNSQILAQIVLEYVKVLIQVDIVIIHSVNIKTE